MTDPTSTVVQDAAERVLSEAFGAVRLDAGTLLDSSGRSNLFRFSRLSGSDSAPASVIVKRAAAMGDEAYDPDQPGGPASRLFNEWASLQFLGEMAPDPPLAPRLYGGDREVGILVMEDLGHSAEGLPDRLLGDDSVAAEADLVAYATTVGRMHGRTVGYVARFHELRDALGPSGPDQLGHDWIPSTFHAMVDALALTAGPAVDDDLTLLMASLASPGEFTALIHADPCPDNWLRTGSTDRLLDFEFGRVGHALLDGVYGRVPFPTCWCIGRLPEHVTRTMERAYRTELARTCSAARDDARYAQAVVEACAHWMILVCRWSPITKLLEADQEWGTGTIRQRLLARLEVVARVTREAHHLEAIGELAEAMSRDLHGRWELEVVPLPLYPAFRTP
ncbi:MAG TPA: phosphotransferase [Thermomicrobiales bacterium]|nr:phosphotransferase [Thermomicrobiales bacterium]